jgi:hypothetical protein
MAARLAADAAEANAAGATWIDRDSLRRAPDRAAWMAGLPINLNSNFVVFIE